MTKIVYKTKIVDVPDKGQKIFKRLSNQYKGRLLWNWSIWNDSYLSNFLDNTVMNFNPPKAINREIQSCFVPRNGRLAVQMDWKEPKGKDK